ncbi:hypothetical protein A5740_03010 [Mycobacterium sp. GA-1841]|nr:hypothetical protein A5740_03010 [Mycobacterium sp. GA-1841]
MKERSLTQPRHVMVLRRFAAALLAGYACLISYLAIVALNPALRTHIPSWWTWFGAPGSSATISVTLGLPLGYLILRRYATGRRLRSASLLVIGGMAVSAIVLAMGAYWKCHEAQSPFFAPLSWTLGLFVGSVENPFLQSDSTSVCASEQMPVALELARLLAIASTLTTAVAAAMTLSRAQLDRIALWRAPALVIVVGIDAESIPLLQAIARNMSPRETLAVLTSNPDSEVIAAVRNVGGRIRTVDLDDDYELAGLTLWPRLDRLYLLSNDPARNLSRYAVIDEQVDRLQSDRVRLPLTVRIDDPWQAEVWRRSFLSSSERRWVADAIGRYEITAAKLIRHIAGNDRAEPTRTVLICGMSPLTHALTSELAQVHREYELYTRPGTDLPNSAVIMAADASGFIADHNLRQQRVAGDGPAVQILPIDSEPTVEMIGQYLKETEPSSVAVILCNTESSGQGVGTRLALRFTGLKIYQVSDSATALTSTSVVGQLYAFPINMDIDATAPQDAWERAAEMIHESYSQRSPRDTPTTRYWKDLDPFVKGSNRRLVINTLWMVEKETRLTWNSLESPPVEPLPEGFTSLSVEDQLKILLLDEAEVDRLIEREHDDWCRYHWARGWRQGAEKSFERKEHPALLTWAELMTTGQAAKYRDVALKTLVGTLINLRNLGYRAVPKEPSVPPVGALFTSADPEVDQRIASEPDNSPIG